MCENKRFELFLSDLVLIILNLSYQESNFIKFTEDVDNGHTECEYASRFKLFAKIL